MEKPLGQALAAEAAGTFLIVGVALLTARWTGPAAAAAVAPTVAIAIFALAWVSGAHFNPAVTVGFAVAHRFLLRRVAPYVVVQVAAGVAAALSLSFWTSPAESMVGAPKVGFANALLVETLGAAFFSWVIAFVAGNPKVPRWVAASSIGGAVGLAMVVAWNLSGAGLNPARVLGPAIAAWSPPQVVHLVGPCVGAVAGFGVEAARRALLKRVHPVGVIG